MELLARIEAFADDLSRRRTVRDFSSRPVARTVIAAALRAAGTAPSGANQQPWRFVAIADESLKRQIREAAEVEERERYHASPWMRSRSLASGQPSRR